MRSILYFIINFITGIIELLLSLRFIFRFLGANTDSIFTAWLYSNTLPLVRPFIGIFQDPIIVGNRFNIEISTLVALIVYGFIGYFLMRLISPIKL